MIRSSSSLIALLVVLLSTKSHAWIPQQQQFTSRSHATMRTPVLATSSNDDQNMDNMHQDKEQDEPNPPQTSSSSSSPLDDAWYDDDCVGEECTIDWDDMMPAVQQVHESKQQQARTPFVEDDADVANSRLRLEMHWEMEETQTMDCDVEAQPQETCGSEPCLDCRGRGERKCRFCGGSAILYDLGPGKRLGGPQSKFRACPICRHGVEACKSCQGTGWVAPWATMSGSTRSSGGTNQTSGDGPY